VSIDEIIVNLVLLGILGLAFWKGGRAERYGAGLYGLCWIAVSLLFTPVDHYSAVYLYGVYIADFIIAVGFLLIALRFSNLWIALAMIAQGFSAAAHAYRLNDAETMIFYQGIPVWRVVINLTSFVVMAALLLGTLSSWWARAYYAKHGRKRWTKVENVWSRTPARLPNSASA
jgi:hypothetical protein